MLGSVIGTVDAAVNNHADFLPVFSREAFFLPLSKFVVLLHTTQSLSLHSAFTAMNFP